MTEFFFQYGLFAAKALTMIIGLLLGLAVFVIIISSKNKNQDTLDIENVNDRLDDLKASLEEEILSKDEFKKLQKAKKKQEKADKKAKKTSKKLAANSDNNDSSDNSDNDNSDFNGTEKSRMFVLRFEGDIHASEVETLREAITSILTIATKKDEVLVILESAGGMVHSYGLAASQLQRIKSKNIKLTAAVDLVAASGGYMMACVADHIIAAPFAVLGSIGVLAQVPNFNRLLRKFDVDIEHHTAGEHKTTLTMLGKNTPKAREKFQEELEDTHVLFKDFVKTNRDKIEIDKIATGEHWYGQQALERNLIDEIKTSDDYLLEKHENTDIYEINYTIHETFREKISSYIYKSGLKVLGKFSQP